MYVHYLSILAELPSCFSLFHLPVTAENISQGSITKLINICATIGASILRSATMYRIASKQPSTVVDNITGKAILISPLKRIQAPCAKPNIKAEANTCTVMLAFINQSIIICLNTISSTIPDTKAAHIPIILSHENVNKCSRTNGTALTVYIIYTIATIKVSIQTIELLNASELIPNLCLINR